MTEYILGSIGDFERGKGRAFDAGGRIIAVFRTDDSFYAIANRCVHKGASMCDGEITSDGTVVRCPWHNWPFDLRNGRNMHDPSERMRTYEVKVDGDTVVLVV